MPTQSPPRHRRPVLACLALSGLLLLGPGPLRAENLDEGKPPARLFAENCASCHRSPRGLSKGRFRLSLYLFMQKHYASNASSAWALSSYLASVDSGNRNARASTPSSRHRGSHATTGSTAALRPPMPVPQR